MYTVFWKGLRKEDDELCEERERERGREGEMSTRDVQPVSRYIPRGLLLVYIVLSVNTRQKGGAGHLILL